MALPNLVRRGLTILVVAPTITWLLLDSLRSMLLVWVLSILAMLEWTAVKRHLKLVLLTSVAFSRLGSPSPASSGTSTPTMTRESGFKEYAVPVARPNVFILVKCVLSTLVVPVSYFFPQQAMFLAVTAYFFFWVVMTLAFQNKAETNSAVARRSVEAKCKVPPAKLSAADEFELRELDAIAAHPIAEVFLNFALEYFGFVWVLGLTYTTAMRFHIPGFGAPAGAFLLIANWANDIAALLIGRSLKGRTHPLYPRISPNKSTEGAVAGVLANGIALALLTHYVAPLCIEDVSEWTPTLWVPAFVFGVVCGVLGVIGDLLQSLFKRTAQVKDTGTVFPGHGGVLDRIDGLLLTMPVAYWALWVYYNLDPMTVHFFGRLGV